MKRLFLKTLHSIYMRLIGLVTPISIGVRIMLIRGDEVLLVKHSYEDKWFFPGGGVKRKETLDQAARREAFEEVGATVGTLELLGIYTNFYELRSDHIAVFTCKDFTLEEKKDWEIEAVEFFPLNEPPKTIAKGIKHRIDDYLNGVQPKDGFGDW